MLVVLSHTQQQRFLAGDRFTEADLRCVFAFCCCCLLLLCCWLVTASLPASPSTRTTLPCAQHKPKQNKNHKTSNGTGTTTTTKTNSNNNNNNNNRRPPAAALLFVLRVFFFFFCVCFLFFLTCVHHTQHVCHPRPFRFCLSLPLQM